MSARRQRRRGGRSADLALGVRLALAGGRSSRMRAAMTALGVGLGVALLLGAASVPSMIKRGQERSAARATPPLGGELKQGHDTLVGVSDTTFRGDDIRGRDVQREGPDAPVPPGTRGLPAPGTMLVSPKLRDLLDSDRGALLRARLDARVVGVIGDAGLRGPAELTFYRGSDRLGPPGQASGAQRVDHFGDGAQAQRLSPLLSLLVAIAVIVLLLPVAVF
ncbi:MAG: hypothetical protein JWO02_321, partial [Solirubrobacterales bacterium]|nr:hypothetical protein [Solirubrobacterales bacterium]